MSRQIEIVRPATVDRSEPIQFVARPRPDRAAMLSRGEVADAATALCQLATDPATVAGIEALATALGVQRDR